MPENRRLVPKKCKRLLLITLFLCFIFASCTNSSPRATNNTATDTTTTDDTVADNADETSPLTVPGYEPLGKTATISFPTTLWLIALANLSNLQDLALYGVRYTDNVEESNIKPINLAWITRLTKLEGITLAGFDIADISPLAELPNLRGIGVARSRVHNYYPLVNSKSLRSISTPELRGTDSDYPFKSKYTEVYEAFSVQTLEELRELFMEKNISFSSPYNR